MPDTASDELGWMLVVPVKRLAVAKTRLRRVAGARREDLALAFACDTVAAALAVPRVGVVVVTDEPIVRDEMTALGALVIDDRPAAGLNPALLYGAAAARSARPAAGVGALAADLPALKPAELASVLAEACRHPCSFVSDAEGIGTTVLLAREPADFQPRFGRRSRAAHRAIGCVELTLADIPSVRRDVDTEVDLHDAQRLGLGPLSLAVAGSLQRQSPQT